MGSISVFKRLGIRTISFPSPRPSPLGRGSTVDRFGLEEPFGVYDRGRIRSKAGSPLRSAPALHRVEQNRSGLRRGRAIWQRNKRSHFGEFFQRGRKILPSLHPLPKEREKARGSSVQRAKMPFGPTLKSAPSGHPHPKPSTPASVPSHPA
jgi:hypothetical protein